MLASLSRSRCLITVEEGGLSLGWGAEIISRACEAGVDGLRVKRVAALDLPVGNSKSLEGAILPSQEWIQQAALNLVKK